MSIIYLVAGQKFHHHGGNTRVGASNTCIDTGVDWQSVVENNTGGKDHDEGGEVGDIVTCGLRLGGAVREQNLTFDVFIENETGRFWYDDEYGY